MKRSEDFRTIFFVLLTMGLLAGVLSIDVSRSSAWLNLALVAVLAFFCYQMNVINHNHTHCATFNSKQTNRIFDFMLTIAQGHPVKAMIQSHCLNHHVHRDEKDWIHVSAAGKGWGLIRYFRYIVVAFRRSSPIEIPEHTSKLPARLKVELKTEVFVLVLYSVLGLYVNAKAFLLFNGVPWLLSLFVLVGINLVQHDECPEDSELTHSRNFTGKLANWFLFNNGYHTIHHLYPGAHWTMLPQMHETHVVPKVGRDYDEKSLVLFFVRHFVFRSF